jgi:uncharacterized membrane protein YbhN (UPF0104 family)
VDQTSAVGAEPVELSAAARRTRLVVSLAILAIFGVWTSAYVYRHASDFGALSHLPGGLLLALFAVAAGSVICNGLYIKFALQAFAVELPARVWLSLTVATSLLNYLTPLRGGMLARAAYLKANYRFGYLDFVSTLSAMYLMVVFVQGGLGLLGMAWLGRSGAPTDPFVTLLLAAATAAAALLMLARVRLPRWRAFPLAQIVRILDGWTLLRRQRALFAKLMLTTLAFALLSLLEVKLAALALGVPLSWASVLLYSSGQNLALLASLTPVALGIAEAVSVYLGATLGYDTSQALMIQALLRSVPLALLLALALPAFHQLGSGTLRARRREAA